MKYVVWTLILPGFYKYHHAAKFAVLNGLHKKKQEEKRVWSNGNYPRIGRTKILGRGGGRGANPEAIYNLNLILNTMLWKSCQNLQADIHFGCRENETNLKRKNIYQFVSFIMFFSIPMY
jgi:hypothetical protein